MKRRDATKISLAVVMIIVFFNLSGYYYLSLADDSDRQEHTLEIIGKYSTEEDSLEDYTEISFGGDLDKVSVDTKNFHQPELQIPLKNSESESEINNDGILDKELEELETNLKRVNQINKDVTARNNAPDIVKNYQHDENDELVGNKHREENDINNSIYSGNNVPEINHGDQSRDDTLKLLREVHNLPQSDHKNEIIIEPIEDSTPSQKPNQVLSDVVEDENSIEKNEQGVGTGPDRLGQETILERNNDEPINNDWENNWDNTNDDPIPNDSEDNDISHNYPDDKDVIIENGAESNKDVYPISDQIKETGLDSADLDAMYNLTRVKNVDLHNLNFLDNYYRYNYKAIEKRIQERMEKIRNLCREPNIERGRQGFQRRYNMYQISELGMSWCPVFKSGSTTWRNYFITKLVKEPPEEYYLDLLKSRQLTNVKKLRKTSEGRQLYKDENEDNVRFSVIRHPYSRLVSHIKSSGRDQEMVNQQGIWIQSAMMEARTRSVTNHSRISEFKAEFIKYFQWLKDGKPGGEFNKSADNPYLDPPYPKLSEMIDHIKKKRQSRNDWDGHWMPGHEFCDFCHHSFNYIIKLEEEPLELWFLVDKLGLWNDRGVFLNRANSSTRKSTEMLEVWEQIRKLSEIQREFIENHFDVDFRMFDYKRRKEGEL